MWGDAHFDVGGLRELQRQAAGMSAQLAAAAAAADAEFTGGDPAGAVEVTVDGQGRPARVRVHAQWARAVGPHGLGAAVIAALQAATQERLTAWAQGLTDADADADAAVDGSHADDTVTRMVPGDPGSPQSRHGIREMFDLIDDALRDLSELEAALEQAATRNETSANTAGTVRVTTVGGAVSAVEFDDYWLRSAPHDRIADAIEQALRAAVRRTAEQRSATERRAPSLARVRQMTASPETLLRQAGLIQ